MKYRNNVYVFFYFLIFISTFFLGTIYIYDPLKLLHKPFFNKEYIVENMRHQAAGIIKNYSFDSVVLGSSLLENTSSSFASKKIGGSFVNLSLPGSDFYERKYVLSNVLNKKNIKTIIYSLDYNGLIYNRKGNKKYPISEFNYLYDNNSLNDIKVYFNNLYLKCIFKFNITKCNATKSDLDMPNAWYYKKHHRVKFGGIENWFNIKKEKIINSDLIKILNYKKSLESNNFNNVSLELRVEKSKEYLNNTIINYVKKYPDTNFFLVLPPYSRLQDSMIAKYDNKSFQLMLENIKYLVNVSKTYKNLKIYGWSNMNFLSDLSHYMDLQHYDISINNMMIKDISLNRTLLTNINVSKYIKEIEAKATAYDIIHIEKTIKKLMIEKGIKYEYN